MSTRAELRARVRSYLDEAAPAYWTDDELNNWIIQSYYYYYQWIIQTFEGYFTTDTLISIVADQAKYPVPADFFKIRLLERVLTNQTVPLRPFDRQETANITSGANYGSFNVPTYRFEGQDIILEPTPDVSVTDGLRLEYYPQPSNLPLDTSELDAGYLEIWEEPIVLRAVISAKQKEEAVANSGTDLGPLGMQLTQCEQNIKEAAEQRTTNRRYTEAYGSDDGNWV